MARRTSLCRAHDRGGAGVRAAGHRAPLVADAGVGAPSLPGFGGEEKHLPAARWASLCRAHDRGGGASVWAAGHRAPPAVAAGVGARAPPLPSPSGGAPAAVRRSVQRWGLGKEGARLQGETEGGATADGAFAVVAGGCPMRRSSPLFFSPSSRSRWPPC
jgi:hypothetical protein